MAQGNAGSVVPAARRTNVGNPSAGPISIGAPEVDEGTFSVSLVNSGTVAKKYIIGDGHGVWADASGETVANPDGGDLTGSVLNASFISVPVAIAAITYSTSSDKQQFNQSFRYVRGGKNGNSPTNKINWARTQSSADQNTLVKTMVFQEGSQPILSGCTGLVVTVLAGETVNLEFTIGSYVK